MPTVTTTARDQVLPAVRNGLTTAKTKGGELLTSDAAYEARRRGAAVVKAARGEPVIVTSPGRRWTFGLGMLALGGALGAGALWLARRFMVSAPYESERTTFHEGAMPSGNVTTTGSTANEDIDLRAGAPSTP
jgi:hypothetical protein